MKKITVVIPAGNEAIGIGDLVRRIIGLDSSLNVLVLVSLTSTDNTRLVVKRLETETGRVRLIEYGDHSNFAARYALGFREALDERAEAVIEMDAGGTHKPELIPQFVNRLREGDDAVFASRMIQGGGIGPQRPLRLILSYGGTLLARAFLGVGLSDMTSGFEAFSRRVLDKVPFENFMSTKAAPQFWQTEARTWVWYILKNHAWRYTEIPIFHPGGSKPLPAKTIALSLWYLTILFWYRVSGQLGKSQKSG